MKTKILFASLVACSVLFQVHAASSPNWPAWRGPFANGTSPDSSPPTEWSDTKNVKWKVKLPGKGSATPAVWNDKVFILTAIEESKPAEPASAPVVTNPPPGGSDTNNAPGEGRRRRGGGMGRSEKPTQKVQSVVICLDRGTGKTLWQKTVHEGVPHEGHHRDHGFASPSPITDGKVVLAYFGSRGLYCLDMDGKLKWSKGFGQTQMRGTFGEGASPALHGETVVVNWDHEGDDFITALDKNTGKELWRTMRQEESSWGTPLIVDYKDQPQVIIGATMRTRSYDLKTGKQIWECSGQTANMIPCAVADADTVYAVSGFRNAAAQAIKLGRTGDLTGTDAVRWSYDKNTPYVPSPVLAANRLYFLSNRGAALTCFDTQSGKPHFEAEKLPGIFNAYASPVASRDHVYVLGREGKCVVVKQSDKPEIVSTNSIPEGTDATIALAGKELFLRGSENLYCIAEK